ncbi:tripartite tricarboxylate transporter substrate-binding protein [Paralcaligenes ureilyticus]|uniref:Tripartite-type tricarboxylate transporter receptor subunit TctC n=1 Tax=Paralcaligenes ureilyticus TaxID=627131 RepID=A0A4R3M6F9_9BURK|nr:tripartite tricarboxylate transporter substrate-binding protein [Paralcaligenes ureilyticus]TCT08652.1 tripartite-type tricarboxylate transporter receptor subunit TctC [Paralcaligenes ureilyticus]
MRGILLKMAALVFAACSGLAAATAFAGPGRLDGPLTMIVGYAPGGASDRAARIIAQELQSNLGIFITIENRTGAGGRVAADYVKATPAKNVVLLSNPAVMVAAPLVYKKLAYDPRADFKAVSMVAQYQFGVAVASDSPIKNLAGLVDWARAHPDEFKLSVPATGSLSHFVGLMLADKIGVKAGIVGHRDPALPMADLIDHSVPFAVDTLDMQVAQHLNKKIRILATSGTEREPQLSAIPTFTQAGVKLEALGWNAFFAPASMPNAEVRMLGKAIMEVVSTPSVQKTLRENGLIPVVADAAKTEQLIDAFRQRWEPVIRSSGFVVDK